MMYYLTAIFNCHSCHKDLRLNHIYLNIFDLMVCLQILVSVQSHMHLSLLNLWIFCWVLIDFIFINDRAILQYMALWLISNIAISLSATHRWHQRVFLSFHASFLPTSVYSSICLSILNSNFTILTLPGFQILIWDLVGWCTVPWSRLLYKMAMLGQFLHVSLNRIFHDRLGPVAPFTNMV